MIGRVTGILLLSCGAAQAACSQNDLSGTWRMFISGSNIQHCTIKFDGPRVTGSCVHDTGRGQITLGRFAVERNCTFSGRVFLNYVQAFQFKNAALGSGVASGLIGDLPPKKMFTMVRTR